ncbi:serine/arginine repetitive matrix protein [Parasponia andersonii]|uniref:Serine/arginine repetitive matrix protein n=1 Tax=Parasponia andersonii TaxID=3476 RepID=A0A2P5AR36_PARAD|nr:serine/arginine repetitive matrix protein [Parasponia andersonii]
MEPIDHHHHHHRHDPSQDERAVPEAVDLLESSWFFGNLLINQKPKMSRCYSDPCPSSSVTNISHEMVTGLKINSESNGNSSISKSRTPAEAAEFRRGLVRTPSLPPNIGRKEEEEEEEEGILERHDRDNTRVLSKLNQKEAGFQERERKNRRSITTRQSVQQPSKNLLVRTKTLPTYTKRVEMNQDQEESNDKMLSKSSRQASLNLADILPPRHNKGTSRYRGPKTIVVEGIDTDGSREMRRRYLNGRNLRSLSDLEIEEVQGFKDLGFTFDNKDKLSPSVVNIIPGLQEKKNEDMHLENKVRRPYLSEAWLVQSCAPPPPPPPPNWAARKSSRDMKAQIKFWARSVAYNVRLEC